MGYGAACSTHQAVFAYVFAGMVFTAKLRVLVACNFACLMTMSQQAPPPAQVRLQSSTYMAAMFYTQHATVHV